jgi:hypothetical protein
MIPSPSRTETRPVRRGPVAPNLPTPRSGLSWFLLRSQHPHGTAQAVPSRTETVYALARPRQMKRCARRVLLWSLGFYALVALVLHCLMYFWCPDLAECVHRFKWPRLRQLAAETADRPLVISLGSSRMDAAFQAGRLDGLPGPDGRPLAAYNFGIPAAGPLHEYQYLRDMLDEGIRPSLLVVEVLPPLFSAPHSYLISEEGWGVADWMSLHQFHRMHRYFARPDRKLGEWVVARLAPAHVYRRALQGWLETRLLPPEEGRPVPYEHDRWGCRRPNDLTAKQRDSCVTMARDYIMSLNHFRLGAGPVRALRDLLQCCRREGIAVVLVLMPESSEFRSWYRPECLETMSRLLDELHSTTGVPVLDARKWLDDRDFTDGHHPEESGARIFTTRLLAEMAALAEEGNERVIQPAP